MAACTPRWQESTPLTQNALYGGWGSGPRDIYDLMGKDAVVFHHSVHSGQPADPPYIEQTRAWFNAMWDNISYEFPA